MHGSIVGLTHRTQVADYKNVACSEREAIDPGESPTCVLGSPALFDTTDLLTAAKTPRESAIFICNTSNGNVDIYLPQEAKLQRLNKIYELLGGKLQNVRKTPIDRTDRQQGS